MRLENYITHGEYLDTIELAHKIKKTYGINDYYMFKKMCMIVAYIQGKGQPYRSYRHFLNECLHIISLELKIDYAYRLNKRKRNNHYTRRFFGVPIAYIYDFNVLELDEYLTNPKNIKHNYNNYEY